MLAYVTSRLLQIVPHALVILTLIFVLFRLVPGDPAVLAAGITATPDQISAMRHLLGLDRPLLIQYLSFLWHLFHADLGTSVTFGLPVTGIVAHRLPATATLAASSLAVAVAIGVPIGVLEAVRPKGMSGQAVSAGAVALLAIPNFWLGLLLIDLFAVRLHWLPVAGTGGIAFLVMPTIAIAARLVAVVSRTTRANLTEVLSEDYIRTAQAKGLARIPVLLRHALRPALIPIVTVIGLQAGYLLGGSLVIETLFDWQGLGQAIINAVALCDYFLVQGITVLPSHLIFMYPMHCITRRPGVSRLVSAPGHFHASGVHRGNLRYAGVCSDEVRVTSRCAPRPTARRPHATVGAGSADRGSNESCHCPRIGESSQRSARSCGSLA